MKEEEELRKTKKEKYHSRQGARLVDSRLVGRELTR